MYLTVQPAETHTIIVAAGMKAEIVAFKMFRGGEIIWMSQIMITESFCQG
jgi:hypothetical protein